MNNSRHTFSLLMVDDEPAVLSALKRLFFEEKYHIHTAQSAQEALALISRVRIDAALVDLKMPEMDGLALLTVLKNDYPLIMVIILTGHGGIQEAVEAIKLGAVDFLEKPYAPEGLRARMAQLYKIWQFSEENRKLKEEIDFQFGFEKLVGNSTAILKLKQMIVQVGPGDASILIQGETGTGKELVARALHRHSRRSDNSFVPVDCAAISETVIESELFGHVKGAFTGAHIATLGLIRSADKGTLFLDEVGELSPAMQAKLLRTLQEGEVRPVGSSKSYKVDIRLVAATNRDLTEGIARKTFREDLYYRLNVVALNVPPLRDRKDDIPLLTRFFVKRFGSKYSPVKDISKQAFICLQNHDWPGNIRELENVIRRAMALAKDESIQPEDFPPNIYTPSDNAAQGIEAPRDDSMEAYEMAAIDNALSQCGSNRKKAAQILKISEATLYRKIKKYNIKT
jgi:DNA-binding NtrC family response regulator